ncbi:YfjI family protein [Peribacillus sp. V2I11]|uniref:YfjI family protein n=1 Tax=Peribacillus sp. V2I11 TaxID=3042277 RepID=UPI00277F3BBA|nr:YfjI family protein [Peribacillus sp. V2I11]MDQ0880960.1 replicative DNA helicase [Peribacillus sp. V2I11]
MSLNIELMAEYEAVKEVKKAERKKEHQIEWQEPIQFDDYMLPPFPVDVFPKWLRHYVEGVAESTQTPIDAPGMAAISVLSTALTKLFYVRLTGEWSESLNTYTILALPPGNRKSSVFKTLLEPIMHYEKEERERLAKEVSEQKAKLKAKQKRLDHLEKEYAKDGNPATLNEIFDLTNEIEEEKILSLPRFITEDVTPEKLADLMAENNEKMALLSAEGGGIFSIMAGRYSSDGKANIEIFLKGFSGDYCAVDRIGRAAIILNEPALTICLFLQPHVVQGVPAIFLERGLMPRFLFSFPHSLVGHRKITPQVIEAEVKNEYLLNVKKLLYLKAAEEVQLTLHNNGRQAEEAFRGEIEKMFLDGGELAEMKEWGSKLSGQIIRLAGLLHVAEHVQALPMDVPNIEGIPKQIQAETIIKAQQLARYFIEHAKVAYGCMGADKGTQDAKYLLGLIKRQNKPVIEYREIQNLTRKRFIKAVHLKTTLLELEERGYIHQKKDGRKKLLEVNPYILDTLKSTHITHNSPQTPSKREKPRGDAKYTSLHNTHNSSRDKSKVGNVYQRVPEAPTPQNQKPQEITQNVGNVGKYPGVEGDEDLII